MKARNRLLVLALAAALPAAAPLAAADLREAVAAELGSLVEVFKRLHARPELSYQEKETAAFLAGELRGLGFEVTEKVGKYANHDLVSYGLVGVMANGDGPTVMVRTDLDGLPIEERSGLDYASRARGAGEDGGEVPVMHACGHDLHMTSFLGTARLLSAARDRWRGTLVVIGQPAEERGAGARAMLADGLYERFPRPDYVLALHTEPTLPAGQVGLVPGYALANVDSVDITIQGQGGHGAYPHASKDPVTLAAQVIVNLQTIVSRQVSPFDPAVITVGSIHGGSKHNIIPDEVKLQLTVRSYRPEVRRLLLDSIRRVTEETARAAGFPEELQPRVVIREEEFTPSTYNDPELIERLQAVFDRALGDGRAVRTGPVMGGEDFSRYGLEGEVPIAMFWLGAVAAERKAAFEAEGRRLPPLHSAEFVAAPEAAIRTGVTAMTSAVLDLLRP